MMPEQVKNKLIKFSNTHGNPGKIHPDTFDDVPEASDSEWQKTTSY